MNRSHEHLKMHSCKYFILSSILILILISVVRSDISSKKTPTPTPTSPLPLLYLGKHVSNCGLDSPELFYWEVAQPAVTKLNEETHGFFGILMDKLAESINDDEDSDLDPEDEEKLEKQWVYIMETIQNSLDLGIERVTRSWAIVVAISDTPPLPWEAPLKGQLVREFINELEFQYVMIGAVVKAGVKEVVGTLQGQVTNVIKQLEKNVAQLTKDEENVEESKLLDKMEKSFEQMSSSDFITKLMRRIVKRAIRARSPKGQAEPPRQVFFSSMMEQTAIVFEAYRVKGQVFPKFWREITHIMKTEVKANTRDLSSFLHHFNSNTELFVENVFAILVSAIPNAK